MYEITSNPFVRCTLATFRSAEFGFLGVVVYTRVHTPRLAGQFSSAGTLLFVTGAWRGLRTSWLVVGIYIGPEMLLKNLLQRAKGWNYMRRIDKRQGVGAVKANSSASGDIGKLNNCLAASPPDVCMRRARW